MIAVSCSSATGLIAGDGKQCRRAEPLNPTLPNCRSISCPIVSPRARACKVWPFRPPPSAASDLTGAGSGGDQATMRCVADCRRTLACAIVPPRRLKFLDFWQHAAEYFEPEVFLVTQPVSPALNHTEVSVPLPPTPNLAGRQQAPQYRLRAEGVLWPALGLQQGSLGAEILRELARSTQVATLEALREFR